MMFYYRADLFEQSASRSRPPGTSSPRRPRARAAEGPEEVPDHLLRGRPRLVRRAGPAGRRPVVGRQRRQRGRSASTTRPPRRSPTTGAAWSQEGVIDKQPDVHPRVEQGAQRRHAGRLARARSGGPACCRGNAPDTAGQVGDRAAAAVDRRREQRPAAGAARPPRSRPTPSTQAAAAEFAAWLNTDPAARHRRWSRRPASTRPPPDAQTGTALADRAGVLLQPARLLHRGQADRRHRRRASPAARTSTSPTAPTRTPSARRSQNKAAFGAALEHDADDATVATT